MGCDIHAFIEYKDKRSESWNPFGSEIHLDRNYSIFGFMCNGVRSDHNNGYSARGLPSDLAYNAKGANWLYITDDKDEPNTATLEEALKWHRDGKGSIIKYDSKGDPQYVEHPDWHSHSWLTTTEYNDCLNKAFYTSPDYLAVLASMKSFKENNCDVRLIFWFDN